MCCLNTPAICRYVEKTYRAERQSREAPVLLPGGGGGALEAPPGASKARDLASVFLKTGPSIGHQKV